MTDNTSNPFNIGGLLLLILGAVYVIPAIVAQSRRHRQRLAITVLNVFAGWTVIGWPACSVLAGTSAADDQRRDRHALRQGISESD
jgi:hypothetical protein